MKKQDKIDLRMAKKILNKKEISKLKKIKDKKEKTEALKYLISSKLYLMHSELEDRIAELKEGKSKDCLFAELELIKMPYKIKLFKAGFNEELKNILNQFKKIEKLLENV